MQGTQTFTIQEVCLCVDKMRLPNDSEVTAGEYIIFLPNKLIFVTESINNINNVVNLSKHVPNGEKAK